MPPDTSKSRESGSRGVAATRARKESILSAALECFSEHGIEHTTIQQIQVRANCSIGSLYHHFGSKEGIAEELFLEGIAQLNQAMLEEIRRAADAQQSVHAVVRRLLRLVHRTSRTWPAICTRGTSISPSRRGSACGRYIRAYITEVFTWFAPFVAEQGEMRVLPVETYVPLISGATRNTSAAGCRAIIDKGPREVKQLFAEAAWNAVKS